MHLWGGIAQVRDRAEEEKIGDGGVTAAQRPLKSVVPVQIRVVALKGIRMWKLIICGSRDFNDYALMKTVLDQVREKFHIISGGARGADALGERYANEHNLQLTVIRADWDRFGRSAGPRRNLEMLKVADGIIAFWDGASRGTKHMIDETRKAGKSVAVIRTKVFKKGREQQMS